MKNSRFASAVPSFKGQTTTSISIYGFTVELPECGLHGDPVASNLEREDALAKQGAYS